MSIELNEFKKRLEDIKNWLSKELSSIRTGRATISLLDDIRVESYGNLSPVNQLATVNLEDPKTIRIIPWDKSVIKEIELSLTKANLGVSVMSDADGLRVKFPDLTGETRELLVKQAYKKVEEAKISLRNERGDTIKDAEKQEKEGSISEDDLKRIKDEIQKEVDRLGKDLDEMGKLKEQEIKS